MSFVVLDSGAVRQATGFGSDEFDMQVAVVVPAVEEQRVVELIAGQHAAELRVDVLITIVVDIGERNAMPFLQMAEPSGCADVQEVHALVIAQHDVGDERLEVRISASAVKALTPPLM